MLKSLPLLLVLLLPHLLFAEQLPLDQIIKNNTSTFSSSSNGFNGEGWNKIITAAKKANNVVIGEEHFSHEIPYFFDQLSDEIKFDNFFIEMDPISADRIESQIKELSENQLENYTNKYSYAFSFYALAAEFKLLQKMVKAHANIIGLDQVLLIADGLICEQLIETSNNDAAIKVYKNIIKQSKIHYDNFLENNENPFYLFTKGFEQDLAKLSVLALNDHEQEVLKAFKLTHKIYSSGSHHLRIQLMKNNLMKYIEAVKMQKNLYKFGALHVSKSESFFKIFDIGTLINNVSDSQFTKSLHIIVLPKTGMLGAPIKGVPHSKVDSLNKNTKHLKPFFDATNGKNWHVFDLNTIGRKLKENNAKIDDISLTRTLNGYDYLIIIPEVTAENFM